MEGSSGVRSYRELNAWRKAMDLVDLVYTATRTWPKDEMYGLTNQIRRAVVSIPSNIAEGQGHGPSKEFIHYLRIARSSLLEMETQALIAQRLGYLQADAAERILSKSDEVSRLITALTRSIKTS